MLKVFLNKIAKLNRAKFGSIFVLALLLGSTLLYQNCGSDNLAKIASGIAVSRVTSTGNLSVSTSAPQIQFLRVSADSVVSGTPVTFTWLVTGDPLTSLKLNGVDVLNANGTSTLIVTETKTYTLEATNSVGFVSANVTVGVPGTSPTPSPSPTAPLITKFTADSGTINLEDVITFTWDVSSYTPLTSLLLFFDADANYSLSALSGTVGYKPTTTGTFNFRLVASNATGVTTKEVTVTVLPSTPSLPVITLFTATPSAINSGDTTKLSWDVSSYTTTTAVALTGPQLNLLGVGMKGSTDVRPQVTSTYTLVAENAAGKTVKDLNITVTPSTPVPPEITSFTVTSSTVKSMDLVTFSWSVTSHNSTAPSITLSGPELNFVTPITSYSLKVRVFVTGTYILTAQTAAGTSTKELTITVLP